MTEWDEDSLQAALAEALEEKGMWFVIMYFIVHNFIQINISNATYLQCNSQYIT